jgi:hypothetical protein
MRRQGRHYPSPLRGAPGQPRRGRRQGVKRMAKIDGYRMAKTLPSIERLRSQFSYQPETGRIIWIDRRSGVSCGADAGSVKKHYVIVMIDRQPVLAHRLAWKLYHGTEPPEFIDHINGDTKDNRISNLREATFLQNNQNKGLSIRNKTGHRGVTFCRQTKKFKAAIRSSGRCYTLGRFSNVAEAAEVYREAAKKVFGEFAGLNRMEG